MMTVLKVHTQIFTLLKLSMLHRQLLKTAHGTIGLGLGGGWG